MEEKADGEKADEGVRKKVVELSVQSGVSSAHTAFIAVNKSNSETIQGPLVRRNVFTPMLMRCCALAAPASIELDLCNYNLGISEECVYECFDVSEECDYDSGISYNTVEIAEQPLKDPFLQLVSLQKASGCWLLSADLATAIGKTIEEVVKSNPVVNQDVWATVLALIWLHGFKTNVKEEWELLAMKSVSWLRAQNASCVTKCLEAGNALLACNVQKDSLGL